MVIKLGVAKILFCPSASNAINKAPILGTNVAPGPIAITPPVTLDNCPVSPKELRLVPTLSVKLPTPNLPFDPENCSPRRFVVWSEISAIIASTKICLGFRSSLRIAKAISVTHCS